MKILITGASGEIGARLAHHLLSQNVHEVRLLSRSRGVRLARWGAVDFHPGSLSNRTELKEALNGIDVVINCAIDKRSTETESELVDINRQNIINLLECAESLGVKKIIDLSSIAVLPPKVTKDIFDLPYLYSTEDDWYTQAKIETEKISRDFRNRSKLEIGIVRAGIVYGPYMHWSSMSLKRLLNYTLVLPECDSICHAIHVDDLCHLLLYMAVMNSPLPEMTYGINPETISWKEFYEKHASASGIPQRWVSLQPISKINEMHQVKGDELMLPSFKRSLIDSLRSLSKAVPSSIKLSSALANITYKLKAMNYGLIKYPDYIKPTKGAPKMAFYPNEFELNLYQTDAMPQAAMCKPDNAFTYQIPIDKGVQEAAAWWDFSVK